MEIVLNEVGLALLVGIVGFVSYGVSSVMAGGGKRDEDNGEGCTIL